MTSRALDTVDKCVERADACILTAEALTAGGDEWAVVCYFYGAYHVARAAFLADPVFDSLAALASKSSRITMQDRYVAFHRGRKNDKERKPGVNDVVRELYTGVSFEYLELHQWSINVRYNEGLEPSASLGQAEAYYNHIRQTYDQGQFVA